MFDLITVGDATVDAFLSLHNSDIHCRVDEKSCELCVRYGDKIPLDACTFALGGDACNVAVGARRLGLSAGICCEIGDDEFAQKITNTLKKETVDISLVVQTPGTQSTFAIALNIKGERTMFIKHETRMHQFSFDDVQTGWVYLTSLGNVWEGVYEKTLALVKEHNTKLAFAPGTLQIMAGYEKIKDALSIADILIVNKEEAISIAKSNREIDQLLKKLKTLGPKTVIITEGTQGSHCLDEAGNQYFQPIFPEHIVERTGAGDAYSAGFLAATMQGKPVQTAMVWGTLNAGSVVEKIGAQEGLLTKEGMEEKVKKFSDTAIEQ